MLAFVWVVGSVVFLGALGVALAFGSGGAAFLVLGLAWLLFSGLLWLAGRRRLRLRTRRA